MFVVLELAESVRKVEKVVMNKDKFLGFSLYLDLI